MRLILYVVRRLLILIPTLLGVTLITFALSHAPGPNLAVAVYCNPHLGACTIDNPLLKPIVDHIADFLLNHVLVGLLQGIATALHKEFNGFRVGARRTGRAGRTPIDAGRAPRPQTQSGHGAGSRLAKLASS